MPATQQCMPLRCVPAFVVCALLIVATHGLCQAPLRPPTTVEQGATRRNGKLRALPPVEVAPDADAVPADATWTLADVERIALTTHPALAEASSRVAALRGKWWQAGRKVNPMVGYVAEEIGEAGSAGRHGMSVSQTFLLGHKRGWRDAVVAREVDVAEQQLAATELRVMTDVRIWFQRTLLAQYRLELLDELQQVARDSEEKIGRLLNVMEARKIELLQARVQSQQITLKRQQAQARLHASWRSLLTALGGPPLAPRPLAGSLRELAPQYDWATIRSRLLASSPRLAAAAMEIERARTEISRQHAEAVPDLTARVAVMGDSASGDTLTSVGLSVPLPVWHRNEGNIAKAGAELAAAQQAYRRLELAAEQRLAQVYQQYVEARLEVDRYEEAILPAASESVDIIQTTAQADEATFIEVAVIRQIYYQAQLDYLDALDRLTVAALRLEGLLLEGALEMD